MARRPGLVAAIGINLAAILGGGIFLLPGRLADLGTAGALAAVILAGTVALAVGSNLSVLAARIPGGGGLYLQTRTLLGPGPGLLTGWVWNTANLIGGAALAIGGAATFATVFPGLPIGPSAAVFTLLVTAFCLQGILRGSRLVLALLGLLGIVLLGLVAAPLLVPPGPASPLLRGTPADVVAVAALLFFAFGGVVRATACAGEFEAPRRTVPRAVILSVLVSIGAYATIGVATSVLAGGRILGAAPAPLDTVAQWTGIPWLPPAVLIGTMAAATLGVLTAILALSRVMAAMADHGDLPFVLAGKEGEPPVSAVILAGTAMALLALTGDMTALLDAGALCRLLYCATAGGAALRVTTTPVRKSIAVFGTSCCLVLIGVLITWNPLAPAYVVAVAVIGWLGSRLRHRCGAPAHGLQPVDE